jgi:hypothetical protein
VFRPGAPKLSGAREGWVFFFYTRVYHISSFDGLYVEYTMCLGCFFHVCTCMTCAVLKRLHRCLVSMCGCCRSSEEDGGNRKHKFIRMFDTSEERVTEAVYSIE